MTAPTPHTFLQPDGWVPAKGYANGVLAEGRMVFTGGLVGWNENQEWVETDMVGQFRQTLKNIVAVLAEAGATVIATDIAKEAQFDAANIIYRSYDVTSQDQTKSIIADTKKEYGSIDALILCAGTISHKHLTESTDDEWQSILDVNLMGVVNPLREIFPVMADQGMGKIVALGSLAPKHRGGGARPAGLPPVVPS